jgi:hypothetical protein
LPGPGWPSFDDCPSGDAERGHDVIVWLWDTHGPARSGQGITDDEDRAIQNVETLMRSGQANVAQVESAHAELGIRTLTSGYQRTGQG